MIGKEFIFEIDHRVMELRSVGGSWGEGGLGRGRNLISFRGIFYKNTLNLNFECIEALKTATGTTSG